MTDPLSEWNIPDYPPFRWAEAGPDACTVCRPVVTELGNEFVLVCYHCHRAWKTGQRLTTLSGRVLQTSNAAIWAGARAWYQKESVA